MIRKLKTNILFTSKHKYPSSFLYTNSEDLQKKRFLYFYSGKKLTVFRKRRMHWFQYYWFHVLKHNNQIVFSKKRLSKNLFNSKKIISLVKYLKYRFELIYDFYFKQQQSQQNLFSFIPRFFFFYVLNNQQDFFFQKTVVNLKTIESLKGLLLLKKKTPSKFAILNYYSLFNFYFFFYKFILFNDSTFSYSFPLNSFLCFYKISILLSFN